MTTQIKYVGKAGIRELAAADLAKAGVEGFTKKSFIRGEITSVEDDVAEALTNRTELFGPFEIVEPVTKPAAETDSKPAIKR